MLEERTLLKPGIYLITGGRQIGKTTFLKQLIEKWLAEGEVNYIPEWDKTIKYIADDGEWRTG